MGRGHPERRSTFPDDGSRPSRETVDLLEEGSNLPRKTERGSRPRLESSSEAAGWISSKAGIISYQGRRR